MSLVAVAFDVFVTPIYFSGIHSSVKSFCTFIQYFFNNDKLAFIKLIFEAVKKFCFLQRKFNSCVSALIISSPRPVSGFIFYIFRAVMQSQVFCE